MTARELSLKALRMVGNTTPKPEEVQSAYDHLNSIISNWAYWDESIQPIRSFPLLTTEINLPPYYTEIFELLVAAREAISYGLSSSQIEYMELKARLLTNGLTYRNLTASTLVCAPTTMVV